MPVLFASSYRLICLSSNNLSSIIRIMVEIALSYDTTGVPTITTFVDEIGENTYEVTGKVTVKDKYGDSYTGKYDAEVEYNPATDNCDVDLELGDLYKD